MIRFLLALISVATVCAQAFCLQPVITPLADSLEWYSVEAGPWVMNQAWFVAKGRNADYFSYTCYLYRVDSTSSVSNPIVVSDVNGVGISDHSLILSDGSGGCVLVTGGEAFRYNSIGQQLWRISFTDTSLKPQGVVVDGQVVLIWLLNDATNRLLQLNMARLRLDTGELLEPYGGQTIAWQPRFPDGFLYGDIAVDSARHSFLSPSIAAIVAGDTLFCLLATGELYTLAAMPQSLNLCHVATYPSGILVVGGRQPYGQGDQHAHAYWFSGDTLSASYVLGDFLEVAVGLNLVCCYSFGSTVHAWSFDHQSYKSVILGGTRERLLTNIGNYPTIVASDSSTVICSVLGDNLIVQRFYGTQPIWSAPVTLASLAWVGQYVTWSIVGGADAVVACLDRTFRSAVVWVMNDSGCVTSNVGTVAPNALPLDGILYDPYPNPTNGTVDIAFEARGNETTTVSVYNMTGQLEGELFRGRTSGLQQLHWQPTGSSGLRFVVLESPSSTLVKRFVYLR